jgi:hypothetical protein
MALTTSDENVGEGFQFFGERVEGGYHLWIKEKGILIDRVKRSTLFGPLLELHKLENT